MWTFVNWQDCGSSAVPLSNAPERTLNIHVNLWSQGIGFLVTYHTGDVTQGCRWWRRSKLRPICKYACLCASINVAWLTGWITCSSYFRIWCWMFEVEYKLKGKWIQDKCLSSASICVLTLLTVLTSGIFTYSYVHLHIHVRRSHWSYSGCKQYSWCKCCSDESLTWKGCSSIFDRIRLYL